MCKDLRLSSGLEYALATRILSLYAVVVYRQVYHDENSMHDL